jgi:hypothetical protein
VLSDIDNPAELAKSLNDEIKKLQYLKYRSIPILITTADIRNNRRLGVDSIGGGNPLPFS